jgi:hypothetical protein
MASRLDGAKVNVRGLDDLRRELKKLDEAGLIDGLKDVNQSVAALVVGWAQSRASTPLEKKAAATLKASRTQARAQVTFGGAKSQFAEGAEFGATRDLLRTTPGGRSVLGWNQFKDWRGNKEDAGYFLFPAIRAHEEEIAEQYLDGIEKLASKAFPD